MRRGTTPTIEMSFKDIDGETVDLSSYTVYLTIDDTKGHQTTFSNDRMTFNDDHTIDIKLTQDETLSFKGSYVQAQIRAIDDTDTAIASDIVTVTLEQILKEGTI